MKKLSLLTFLAVLAMFFTITSCKQDLPSMSAKFDGTQKTFVFRQTTLGEVPAIGSGFIITGTTGADLSDGEYLTLLIRGTDEKSYDLNVALSNSKFQCEAIYRPGGDGDTSKVYAGKTGTITITEFDEKHKRISGTFTFNLVNKVLDTDIISVTEGKFENLNYIKIDATLPTTDFEP
jgi:hypothetical protein